MERLGTVERYFVEVRGIPRLAERIKCFVFSRTYRATHTRVSGCGGDGVWVSEGRKSVWGGRGGVPDAFLILCRLVTRTRFESL